MAAYVSNAGKTWVEKGKREKKMRRRPMKLKHLPTRWNFLYSLCMATTLTDPASSSSCPLHADWNPINAADGGETKKKKKKKQRSVESEGKICKAFNWFFTLSPARCHFLCAAEPSCCCVAVKLPALPLMSKRLGKRANVGGGVAWLGAKQRECERERGRNPFLKCQTRCGVNMSN